MRAIVLIGVAASGTERRMAFVFAELCRRHPGRYLLIINRELYDILQRGGFGLDRFPDAVHILEHRSSLDRKSGAHAGALVNVGRVASLWGYRAEIERLIDQRHVDTVQTFLEMVPFLGLFPLGRVRAIASLVSHLPKYFDRRRWSCRLLLRSLRRYDHVDALYETIALRLTALGVPADKVSFPRRNCVNHERFSPMPKDRIVSFTARFFDFKNPLLMVDAAERIVRRASDVHVYILGQGPLAERLATELRVRGLDRAVTSGYLPDPSTVVNRSPVHVCIETYDNTTNQSLLEGMAAGCAIVASSVGLTGNVVADDAGVLTRLDAEEIADAVLRLLEQPAAAAALGEAGRRRVLAEHHVGTYVEYLHGVHDRVSGIS